MIMKHFTSSSYTFCPKQDRMLEKIMIWHFQPSTWFLGHLLHTWSNYDEGSREVLPIQSDDLAEIPMDETDPLGSPI